MKRSSDVLLPSLPLDSLDVGVEITNRANPIDSSGDELEALRAENVKLKSTLDKMLVQLGVLKGVSDANNPLPTDKTNLTPKGNKPADLGLGARATPNETFGMQPITGNVDRSPLYPHAEMNWE